jgi:hypothetical protein
LIPTVGADVPQIHSKSVVWSHTNTTLTSLGCDKNGKFAIFTHGFQGAGGDWIKTLNDNLLKYRGGCVIHLDWGEFAKDPNYFWVNPCLCVENSASLPSL